MQQTRLSWVVVVLALAGLVVSGYLAWYDIVTPRGVCSLTGFLGCSQVLSSPYSRIGRMPTAFLGVVWFAVASWLSMVITKNQNWLVYLLIWSLLGSIGVSVLAYIELFLIGAICPLCTSAHALGIAIFALTLLMWRGRSH